MNSNMYAIGKIWIHPDDEALEPQPTFASMSWMFAAAHKLWAHNGAHI